ncbi:Mnd1p [Ascoidea rubescens DSM 1968]|uniref:Meiotic nuclear division protein 1 n=1 Tax=Ascoidea rubescens DSM 1968 TaxID=1344418 RepID=A0A1D2VH38_9ASCO|nr:meiotic nuclear division protein 1 [Ascoidea rubescens DSM 1968]ODV60797.1 meiotic nuclear division protein 1 [Ascoidea rubescens DSM 1968]
MIALFQDKFSENSRYININCLLKPPKKKGLSLEEKKLKLLEFFKKEHNFYTIKEVESLGSKYIGVNSMQMKEILQHLIDDSLIKFEKCGITNFYWCFEFDLTKSINSNYSNLIKRKTTLIENNQVLAEKIKKEKLSRVNELTANQLLMVKEQLKINNDNGNNDINRNYLLAKVKEFSNDLEKKLQILNDYTENDPRNLDEKINQLTKIGYNIDLITDNIDLLISYWVNNKNLETSALKKEFNIPDEFIDLPNINQFLNN